VTDDKVTSDKSCDKIHILENQIEKFPMISCSGISKKYVSVEALKDITFDVSQGDIFGVIGPDGSGKTTLFRILTTLMLADTGTATVNGLDVVKDYKAIRNIVGYMPGRFSLYQDLTVEENMNFFASVFNTTVEENYDLVKDIYVQIEPFRKRKAGALSGGMKQKLALSCALIHKPVVLFLDEPTTGVDPVSRKEFWGMLQNLKQQGITILVSTPYMDEAALCDRIALIRNGSFLAIDTPQAIINSFNEPLWAVQTNQMSQLLTDLRDNDRVTNCFAFGDKHHMTITNDEQRNPRRSQLQMKNGEAFDEINEKELEWLQEYLENKGHQDIEIDRIQPGIEDCFIRLTM